jgi:hypothetical protein
MIVMAVQKTIMPGTHMMRPPSCWSSTAVRFSKTRGAATYHGYIACSASVMMAETMDMGMPSANRYSMRTGVWMRSSSGTGLTTGHHISTAAR